MDPHIFADQDPGAQKLADPDPKHCVKVSKKGIYNFMAFSHATSDQNVLKLHF